MISFKHTGGAGDEKMRVSVAMKQWLIEAQVYFEIVSSDYRFCARIPEGASNWGDKLQATPQGFQLRRGLGQLPSRESARISRREASQGCSLSSCDHRQNHHSRRGYSE